VGIETYINDQLWFPGQIYTFSPGEQLKFKIKLKNYDDMDINKGKYIIKAVSQENNQTAFQRKSTIFSWPVKESKYSRNPLSSLPRESAIMLFSVEYTDETRPATLATRLDRTIRYQMHARLSYDQPFIITWIRPMSG